MLKEVNPRMLESEPMQRCRLRRCEGACCLHGVWLDAEEVRKIQQNAERIARHMPPGQRDPGCWFEDRRDTDPFTPSGEVIHSTVLPDPDHYGGSACVFFRPDFRCALQVASVAEGFHPWHFKPFYCILHPLDLDEQGRITLDTTDALLDEPGSCLRPAKRPIPLLVTFEPELRYLLGDEAYERILQAL
jgi:hypothetical protein